jgi:hypothetical protein
MCVIAARMAAPPAPSAAASTAPSVTWKNAGFALAAAAALGAGAYLLARKFKANSAAALQAAAALPPEAVCTLPFTSALFPLLCSVLLLRAIVVCEIDAAPHHSELGRRLCPELQPHRHAYAPARHQLCEGQTLPVVPVRARAECGHQSRAPGMSHILSTPNLSSYHLLVLL